MKRLRTFIFWLAWCFTAGCCPECGGGRSEPQVIDGRACDHWYHRPVFREPVSTYEACFNSPLCWLDLSPLGNLAQGNPRREGDAAMLRSRAV